MPLVLDPETLTLPDPDIISEDDTDEFLGLDKPWNVILWNDSVTIADAVVWALVNIVGLDLPKAFKAMEHIHNHGKGIVATTNREHAELLMEQLSDFSIGGVYEAKLTVTLEQS